MHITWRTKIILKQDSDLFTQFAVIQGLESDVQKRYMGLYNDTSNNTNHSTSYIGVYGTTLFQTEFQNQAILNYILGFH